MNTGIIFTWYAQPGEHLTLWYWTNDWGTFNAFQAAPSLRQGYNSGVASVTDVRAYMPYLGDPNLQGFQLAYIIGVQNLSGEAGQPGGIGSSYIDVYNAWQ